MRRLGILALVAATLASCDRGSDPPATPAPPSLATSPAAAALNAGDASLLPDDALALPDVDPAMYETLLQQLSGTPVLVNIWGSWCGPCREEAEHLARASERYGDRVQFVGIDILDDRPSARAFMREFDWRYPSFFDPSPTGLVRDTLGYIGQPITLIYDANGGLVFEWNGPVTAEQLETELRKVV